MRIKVIKKSDIRKSKQIACELSISTYVIVKKSIWLTDK